jgi:ketosteroid isomerase-like protein
MTGAKITAWAMSFALGALIGPETAYATPDSDVQAAVQRFHHALESHDLSKMDPLWVHSDQVVLVNPTSTAVSVGWPAVEENWRLLFNAFTQLTLTQLDGPHVRIRGDVAWATGLVNADIKLKSGAAVREATFETAIFERTDDGWRLVSHIASTAPRFAE